MSRFALCFALLAPVASFAAPPAANALERIDDRTDLADDRRDLRKLLAATERWEIAVSDDDRAAEAAADREIRAWLQAETRESRRDVGEARREVHRSNREVRGSRVDARTGPRNVADQRALRDDRRDRADDQVDRAQARMDLNRTREISQELATMQPTFTSGKANEAQYARKHALLTELRHMARRELGEDREELREDRRETREDRRQPRGRR